ncbi:MAG: endo alpha-1,4 polygalactosaminidase [Deltaproteobacteria bacterium]|nr:endo alpha-1,4 polygalactosaminidase [Deltaproteobacteria bacterium]
MVCLAGCSESNNDYDTGVDSNSDSHFDSNSDTQTELAADTEGDTETGPIANTPTDADTEDTETIRDTHNNTNIDTEDSGTHQDSDNDTNTDTDDSKTNPDSDNDTSIDTEDADDSDDTGSVAKDIRLPPANAPWDYQIGGGYTPPTGVQVVSRDREDSPAPGLYNICYVNGFQIQPNEETWWQTNHPDLILRDSNGDPVVDAGWDEMLLDVRTQTNRDALAIIIGEWIAQCAKDGFDAVEIDNLDSYERSDGLITQDDNTAFMGMLSDISHANGLASAQKNAAAFLENVSQMKTDFAVVEECNRWDECGDYQNAYGDLLFIVEYRKQDFNAGCTAFPELSIVLRNLDVSTPQSGNYVYDGC